MNHYLKSVTDKLNTKGRMALNSALDHAISLRHQEVMPEHLLLALIRQEKKLLESLRQQIEFPTEHILDSMQRELTTISHSPMLTPQFSPDLVQWIINGWLLTSASWGMEELGPAGLIGALLECPEILAQKHHAQLIQKRELEETMQLLKLSSVTDSQCNNPSISAPILLKYTHNLSEQARQGKLDPIHGREVEIRQVIDILLRRRQNNPILTGEPGVGKTALVEGLAMQIKSGYVPDKLKSMEVLTLDLGLLQAGASSKGEFEHRLQELLKEIKKSTQPVILFIDEAHMLIGAGGQAGQNDAANLLKPALARGELRVIAATTWGEYKKYFEKDAALARRFQIVKVPEPDIECAKMMLRAMVPAMEEYHGVSIQESAVHAAVMLSNRYITGRQLPDKSVSLLDTACARVASSQSYEPKEIATIEVKLHSIHSEYEALRRDNQAPERQKQLRQCTEKLQLTLDTLKQEWAHQAALVQTLRQSQDPQDIACGREALNARHQQYPMIFDCVDATCIADVVSGWTGIPLGRILEKERQMVDSLFEHLSARIIGQQHALEYITQQIRISRAGLADPLKPIGVYLLAGPSGTGKSETSLALAELLCGGKHGLVTINMSEYQEAHSVSGLKGSPPGYVGYGQGGILTEAVRRNPYRVVLLDEVEKAHPDVMELFYQVFDKGMIEDTEGQSVNFRNTIIIMTSNLASDVLVTSVENGEQDPEIICHRIRPAFEQLFTPALMSRITLIPYFPLQDCSLARIIQLKLQILCQRYQRATEGQMLLTWNKRVVTWIIANCQVKQNGARNIDQIISQHMLPLIAEQVLQNTSPQNLDMDVKDNVLILNG